MDFRIVELKELNQTVFIRLVLVTPVPVGLDGIETSLDAYVPAWTYPNLRLGDLFTFDSRAGQTRATTSTPGTSAPYGTITGVPPGTAWTWTNPGVTVPNFTTPSTLSNDLRFSQISQNAQVAPSGANEAKVSSVQPQPVQTEFNFPYPEPMTREHLGQEIEEANKRLRKELKREREMGKNV